MKTKYELKKEATEAYKAYKVAKWRNEKTPGSVPESKVELLHELARAKYALVDTADFDAGLDAVAKVESQIAEADKVEAA